MAQLLRPCAAISSNVASVAAAFIDFNQTMRRTRRSASLRFAVAIAYVLVLIASHPSLVTLRQETTVPLIVVNDLTARAVRNRSCDLYLVWFCPPSDNLGQLSVVSFGGSGSSLLEVMRFQLGGASAA